MSSLPENLKDLIPDDAQRALLEALCSEEFGQSHLLDAYSQDADDEKLRGMCEQLLKLDGGYPGGLTSYISKAKKLLEDSKNGVNPLSGWAPKIPQGESFEMGTEKYSETEAKGMELLSKVGFVLVAGGLGERLGYNGAKVRAIYRKDSSNQFLFHNESLSNHIRTSTPLDWIAYRVHNRYSVHTILRILYLGS
jgi:UDP-N-acetylglucosamine pyrophosphorylase